MVDNLSFDNPEVHQDEVEQAAKIAGIYQFIISLPNGYKSEIGDHGINRSEGQKFFDDFQRQGKRKWGLNDYPPNKTIIQILDIDTPIDRITS